MWLLRMRINTVFKEVGMRPFKKRHIRYTQPYGQEGRENAQGVLR